jgi:hypothetical protein
MLVGPDARVDEHRLIRGADQEALVRGEELTARVHPAGDGRVPSVGRRVGEGQLGR